MTRQKNFKLLVRERMAKTGESYTTARRQLLLKTGGPNDASLPKATAGIPPVAGVHSVTAAARILLAAQGHELNEATLLAIGGGVGIGVFTFQYEAFSSFYVAGRHLWHDDLLFLEGLAERLGISLDVLETGSRKKAQEGLESVLEQGPTIAFVDLATLGHRGPIDAYYVVTVLSVDASAGTAMIADLADVPVEVSLDSLAAARAKHRKFKNRLVRFQMPSTSLDLEHATLAGLRACVDGFENPRSPGFNRNFTLDALNGLAVRMRGSGKSSWQEVFPPGPRLWNGLASFYEYVEHYGTGGSLMRGLYADALEETQSLIRRDLSGPVNHYRQAADAWTAAARLALPSTIDEFVRLREIIDDKYAQYLSSGNSAAHVLEQLDRKARDLRTQEFPLNDSQSRQLVNELADAVERAATLERDALTSLRLAVA